MNSISFATLGVALTPETAAKRTQPSHTGVQQLMSNLPPTDSQYVGSFSYVPKLICIFFFFFFFFFL